eukprot:925160-Rhodomonas_salina.1
MLRQRKGALPRDFPRYLLAPYATSVPHIRASVRRPGHHVRNAVSVPDSAGDVTHSYPGLTQYARRPLPSSTCSADCGRPRDQTQSDALLIRICSHLRQHGSHKQHDCQ